MDAAIRTVDSQNYKKIRSTDIILELKPREGGPRDSKQALVDPRLFKGTNRLHAKMNPQNCLWHLEYDSGILPEQLKQRFTGWTPLFKFVTDYYDKRNIDIVNVID